MKGGGLVSERDSLRTDWRTAGPPGGLEIVRFLCDFRSGTRPRIVAAIAAANRKDVMRPGTIPGGYGDGSVFTALAHVVDVEDSWLARIQGEPDPAWPNPERYPDIEATAAIWEQVSERWRAFLDGPSGAQLLIPVGLGEGTIPAWAIVLHTFNHSTHHRAEIWAALTSFGEHPPELDVLDFVFDAGQFIGGERE
jgi:uncharacterized damage-inducible protein DinB